MSQESIFKLLKKENKLMSCNEIIKKLKICRSSAYQSLTKLCSQGICDYVMIERKINPSGKRDVKHYFIIGGSK